MHRLSNPGKIPLKNIEVQCGSYIEEDDIERFDDDFGRVYWIYVLYLVVVMITMVKLS